MNDLGLHKLRLFHAIYDTNTSGKESLVNLSGTVLLMQERSPYDKKQSVQQGTIWFL